MARKKSSSTDDFLTNVRRKTIRTLVKEDVEARKEENKKEEPVEEKEEPVEPKVEKEVVTPKEEKPTEEKKSLSEEEVIARAAKETAKEVAREIREIDKDKELTREEKKKAKEEVRARWTGFDPKTGTITPKSYDEIAEEGARLGFEKAKAWYEEQKRQELEELKKVQAEDQERKTKEEKDYQERVEQVRKSVDEEMEELYKTGKFVRPKDLNNLNDPDAKRVKDFFDQAMAYNNELQKQGKPMESSVARFYLFHYKPSEDIQPAGADAPIAGNRVTEPENTEKFNYVRDIHNVSFRQIRQNAINKIRSIGKR